MVGDGEDDIVLYGISSMVVIVPTILVLAALDSLRMRCCGVELISRGDGIGVRGVFTVRWIRQRSNTVECVYALGSMAVLYRWYCVQLQ